MRRNLISLIVAFISLLFFASLCFESLKLCASFLPSEGSPNNRLNEKSHSSKISLRKVALNKRNLYYSFLLLGTAFLPYPVLFSVIGYYRHEICCTFAVLFSTEGSQALILLHFSAQGLQGREIVPIFLYLFTTMHIPIYGDSSSCANPITLHTYL